MGTRPLADRHRRDEHRLWWNGHGNVVRQIGPANKAKLAAASIKTTDDLLEKCAAPAGRKAMEDTTGIGASTLLKWANMADFMRISGVGRQFSELLEAAGVDTVKELRNRNAANLAEAMKAANDAKKLTKTAPSASTVESWVDQAKKMDPKISY